MEIIDIIFLIVGILIIIGNSLLIFRCKQKYPAEKLDYTSYLLIYFIGIIIVIGAITGLMRLLALLMLISGFIFRIYLSKKDPEKYKEYYSFSIWEKLWGVWIIFFISVIFIVTFF